MSKDLIRKTEIVSNASKDASKDALKKSERTEVDEAAAALAARMLFGAEPRPVQDHPRIILALDATSSMGEYIPKRRITLEAAAAIANALFVKAGSTGLQVKLAFFRGDDQLRRPHGPTTHNPSSTFLQKAAAIAFLEQVVHHSK